MIERKIQTEAYWQNEFSITKQDVEDLRQLFLDLECPLSTLELVQSLMANYCQREKSLIRRSLAGATVYRPNGVFSVGETLVFPHLNFAQGTVVDVREGHNPEYGEFKVISVQMDKEKKQFVSGFQMGHKLAFGDDVPLEEMMVSSPQDLYDRHGALVATKLVEYLEKNGAFVVFRGKWLPRDMMTDVHVGHLNLAEAVLDMQNEPLPPEKLLPDLDLPREASQFVKLFSLNYWMSQDKRFDDVGAGEQIVWGLGRWEPEPVFSPPPWLQYEPIKYDRTKLDVAHLQLEREIDDEMSDLMAPPSMASANTMTLVLTYPHWRAGTLPLTNRTGVFFPGGYVGQHTRITFIDRPRGTEFPGWVVRSGKFVYGLRDWYKLNQVPVGAYIRLEKADDPNRVMIDLVPRRMRREWVCKLIMSEQGDIRFQLQKSPVACEYDQEFLMEVDERVAQAVWEREQGLARPLDDIIQQVFLELAKLSSHGTVHAKSLYNAVNILGRCPPGLVFATLFRLPHFVAVSDNYWMFNENIY